jgi:beta-lactamase regulating signal transducer with metallopeptidase domain
MMGPQLQTIAQLVIGRVLNSLPAGLLIALFAAGMLRLLPRQNSGTRFAVWFVALLAVAALPVTLPLIAAFAGGHSMLAAGDVRPLITVAGRWGLILLLAWVLAASVALLRLASGLWRLRALRRCCVPITGVDLDPLLQKTLADFRASTSVTLAMSECVTVPAAIGFFKPMIVLPVWALQELTSSELNIILLHELAHLRRGDAWTNLLQKFVRAVFLFHPAVWWIERRLSREREMACDDQVLAEISNPRGYAQCLIAILEKSVARRGLAMAQAAVHRAREASLRLAQILDATRPHTNRVWRPALGLVSAFSLLCLMIVPRTPQLVAFELNPRALQADNGRAVLSLAQPQPQPETSIATVIPAALHAHSSSSLKKVHQPTIAPVVARVQGQPPDFLPEHRTPAPQVVAAHFNDNEPTTADAANVEANPSPVAASETLLIIRTTQQIGPNSWVWSVAVWRVNVVNSDRDGAPKVPAAKKT